VPARPEQPAFDFGDAIGDEVPDARSDGPTGSAAAATSAVREPIVEVVVRVRPDQPAIDRVFDYTVPSSMRDRIRVGTMVRIPLHGRRVGGWVVDVGVEPDPTLRLQPIAGVSGWGPPASVLDLAGWAAWRWAGRSASLLRTASPSRNVRELRRRDRPMPPVPTTVVSDELTELAREALAGELVTLRLPPAADPHPLLLAAAALGPVLVIGPSASVMRRQAMRLRRAGVEVALLPDDWGSARAGSVHVLGTRAAAWAPIEHPAVIIVLDEHDEALQQEQAPTWHARDVAIERARRAGVPCVLVSPMPSPEARLAGSVLLTSRSAERAGWPIVEVVDRRDAPPGAGLFSERLVTALRGEGRVVCILNRKGRSRLLACSGCGAIATCERCRASVTQGEDSQLVCVGCSASRPPICASCGSTRMRNLRAGVSRVREELEALAREPVADLTADSELSVGGTGTRIVIGTEAALHQIDDASVVAFLDFDQELLAPRYRASEEALALLVRAARLVGPRDRGGRLLIQTRLPDHDVVQSAVHADPSRLASADDERRRLLRLPPFRASAAVSGAAAQAWIDALGTPDGIEVLGPSEDRWLLRAEDHSTLCDAINAVQRPAGRLRLEVDPLRL
jgi:primosomal protein N' (replication factor Y)